MRKQIQENGATLHKRVQVLPPIPWRFQSAPDQSSAHSGKRRKKKEEREENDEIDGFILPKCMLSPHTSVSAI